MVATTSLGPSRSLHLVRVGEEIVLVGATDQSVTSIARIGAEDAAALVDAAPIERRGAGPAAPGGRGTDTRARAVATATDAHARRAPARADDATLSWSRRPARAVPAPAADPARADRGGPAAAGADPPPPLAAPRLLLSPLVMALACMLWPAAAWAAPGINLNLDSKDGEVSTSLQLLALLTVLSLAPSILIMMTSFTRIIIVLGFVRNALGTPSMPPNQVLVGIALFLSLFVMAPTFTQPSTTRRSSRCSTRRSTRARRSSGPRPRSATSCSSRSTSATWRCSPSSPRRSARRPAPTCPTTVLIPAFVLSELKTAFEIGFLILIPFLVIDMVIASTVMSMGMVMLPPVMISLPFKILLFVLVDGWHLVSESLVQGFQ